MCRILCVHGRAEFDIAEQLKAFADIAENSREYQGHGWGYSCRRDDKWFHYHDISPIWEDPTAHLGRTTLLIAHARSAFRDEGIAVENNMPFYDADNVFVFNGELRGVRIKADGRIGAEKIFNFVKRFDKGDMQAALTRGTDVIHKRSRYVRAMNIIMASPQGIHVASSFGEDPEYFQMSVAQTNERLTICSAPLARCGVWADSSWLTFPNHHVERYERWSPRQ